MNGDEQHLRLLSIFHYVLGGVMALFACFPMFHLVFGIMLLVSPHVLDGPRPEQQMPPQMATFMGLMFTVVPVLIIVTGWTFAVCLLLAGKFLAQHIHYTFCFVIAAISCIFVPMGTVLGVFTIIVLVRPSVKRLFGLEDAGGNPLK
jgi:hypothetical protein